MNLGYILELWQGWPFKMCVCSATSGLLSSYEGHLRNLHESLQGNMDTSRSEVRVQGTLSDCHSDTGILISFQEESGIITFCSIELRVLLLLSKGCEVSCPDEAGT